MDLYTLPYWIAGGIAVLVFLFYAYQVWSLYSGHSRRKSALDKARSKPEK